MLKVESCVTPSPEQFEAVIKGMRLPMKSLAKYDSGICYDSEEELDPLCFVCPKVDHWEDEYTPTCKYITYDDGPLFVLGEKDKRLALNLCKAGDPSHRKFLRQLPLILTVKAPLYWWKQADQYKISTTTNSESTMHTLVKKKFELSDFSFDTNDPDTVPLIINVFNNTDVGMGFEFMDDEFITSSTTNDNLKMEVFEFQLLIVKILNYLRKSYLETDNKNYWRYINELLPQSYNQTRCWSINYETALNIINQRRGHKNKEWDMLIDYLLEFVPYLKEFYEATND